MLPPKLAYSILRWKNVLMTMPVFQLSRRRPGFVKRLIRRGVERQLPAGYDIDTHFKPTYNPWDQRMCLVPDGDLFEAISDGGASVVTDRIETFTERAARSSRAPSSRPTSSSPPPGSTCCPSAGIELAVDGERGRAARDDGLQGDDARAASRTWRSRSATRTPPGR